MLTTIDTLRSFLPDLLKEVKAGRINPAEYLMAAALLLIADDLDAIRKSLSAAPEVKKGK